jgi:F0F1-type ATP synthase membrane subunit c/vacuolar-type H+-ATPase subunit K
VVAAAGVAALIGIGFVRARPLDIADDTRLAGSFRAAMFIGIGLCEAPALLGVAGSLLTDSLWILVLGLVPTMVGFALIAPGPHEIGRRQRQIVAAHSHLDLALALLRPLPPTGA